MRVAAYTCVTVYALREYCTDMCRSVHLSLNGSDKEVLQIEAHTNKITRRRPRQGQTKTDDRMRHRIHGKQRHIHRHKHRDKETDTDTEIKTKRQTQTQR